MPKMFNKIVMIGYDESSFPADKLARIKKTTSQLVLVPSSAKMPLDTDCILVKLGATVDKQMIDSAPNLKYIGMFGTGYGRIDAKYAASKGITVCNVPGYATEAVAEYAFAVLLEHLRHIARGKAQAKAGNYSDTNFEGTEIKGKRFGVVGLGRIGRRIVEIAQNGFSAEVSYWSRHKKKGMKYKELDSLLRESDFISLNLEYNSETKHILNEQRIMSIKPGAVVLNLAPMELVDINALCKRLAKCDLTFILDHSDELSADDAKQLSRYPNCVMYPPVAYLTKEATGAKREIFVSNIENYLKGKPTNKVN